TFTAVDSEVASEHAASFAWPDRASAGGVVTPCVGPDVILQFVIVLSRVARQFFLGYEAVGFQLCRQLPRKADAGDDRVAVLPGRVAALLEVIEIDERRFAWIGRTQHDLAGAVLRMRFQDRPGQVVGLGHSEGRVAREISAKESDERKTEQVGKRPLGPRSE